jgi:hypothetical protein
MHNRLILLSLLALVLLGTALCQVTRIPASQDIYITLGTGNEQVFNQTETLRCGINVTETNGIKSSSYAGAPMIQFDIAGLNITDDDIAILVLKAASIEKGGNDSAMATLLPMSSEWNEDSDYTALLVNILPIWEIVKKNDITQTSSDADEDRIFAFDISKKLKDAKAKGDRISFLIMAISNSSYEIDFLSRESGQGPYLMVMPYPEESKGNLTLALNQNTSLTSNEAETNEIKLNVPGTTAELQNSSGNRSLVFSSQENMDQTTGRLDMDEAALKM